MLPGTRTEPHTNTSIDLRAFRLPKMATNPTEPTSALAAPPPTRAANPSVPNLLPLPAHWTLTPAQLAAREERNKARAHAERTRAVKESMEAGALRSSQTRSKGSVRRSRASNRVGSQIASTLSRPATPRKMLSPSSRLRAAARTSPKQNATTSLWSKIIGGLSWSKRVVASPWLQQYTAAAKSPEKQSTIGSIKRRGGPRRRKRHIMGTIEDGTEDEEFDQLDSAGENDQQPRPRKRKRSVREPGSAPRPMRSTRRANAGTAKPWWMVDAAQQDSPEPGSVEGTKIHRSLQRVVDSSDSSEGDEALRRNRGARATHRTLQLPESEEEEQGSDDDEEKERAKRSEARRRPTRIAAERARASGGLLERPLDIGSHSSTVVHPENELEPKLRANASPQQNAADRGSSTWASPSAQPPRHATTDQPGTSEDDDMDLLAGNSADTIPQVIESAPPDMRSFDPKHQQHRVERSPERFEAMRPRASDSHKATKGVLRGPAMSNKPVKEAAAYKRVSFVPTSHSTQDTSTSPRRPALPPHYNAAKVVESDDDFDALLPDPPAAMMDTAPEHRPGHPASAEAASAQATAEAQHAITRFALQPDVLGRLLQIRQLAQVRLDGVDVALRQRLTREQLAERLALINRIIDGERPEEVRSSSPAKAHKAVSARAGQDHMAHPPDATRPMQKRSPQAQAPPTKTAPSVSKKSAASNQGVPRAPGKAKRKDPSPSRAKLNGPAEIRGSAPSPSKGTGTSAVAASRSAVTPQASPSPAVIVASTAQSAANQRPPVVSPTKSPRQQLAGRARRGAAVKAAELTSLQYKDPWAEGLAEMATEADGARARASTGGDGEDWKDVDSPRSEVVVVDVVDVGGHGNPAVVDNVSLGHATTDQGRKLEARALPEEQQQEAKHLAVQEQEAGREESTSPRPRTVLASTRSKDYSLALYADGSTQ